MRVAVLEGLAECRRGEAPLIARNFDCDAWVVASYQGDTLRPLAAEGVDVPQIGRSTNLVDFYAAMAARFDRVVRIRNPNYPLHPRLNDEVEAEYPAVSHDYVLSTGEECGLEGYSAEFLTGGALPRLRGQVRTQVPSGCLNLAGTERSARHWFSPELRRFFYVDHFETLFASPRFVAVNLIGNCNYTCLKCQYHSSALHAQRQYPGEMSMDRFATLLDRLRSFPAVRTIYPTLTGEPLLHSRIVDVVRMIREAGYSCSFTTNGSLLTPELGERLLDAGLGNLAFSIDTLDPAKYRRLQEGGDLATVERNLIAFRDLTIRKRGSFSGTVNCVVNASNEEEREHFRKHWSERGFTVQFATHYDIFDSNRPYFDESGWGPAARMPCWALWLGLFLTHEGRMVTCGAMAKTLGVRDSIFEMSGPDLWRCEAMQQLRAQQLTGVKPGYCKEFTCWSGLSTTWRVDEDGLKLLSRCSTQHVHQ